MNQIVAIFGAIALALCLLSAIFYMFHVLAEKDTQKGLGTAKDLLLIATFAATIALGLHFEVVEKIFAILGFN